MPFATEAELQAGLTHILESPKSDGRLELIVCRPADNERQILQEGQLDPRQGLIGDNWATRGARSTPDGSANPEMQINLMNSRAIQAITGNQAAWPLAGDQLFVDLDLSGENLPVGTRLTIGTAELVVTAPPHTGCAKFKARFGHAALLFVNSPQGRQLNLRGINAKVTQAGTIRPGDVIRKQPA